MTSPNDHRPLRLARPALATVATLLAVLLVAGCSVAGGSAGPTNPAGGSPGPSGSGSPASPANPTGGPSAPASFYLRAWETQAIAPEDVFGSLPRVTISKGQVIDGMIAVPAIYPGPLIIQPLIRSITPAGIAAILAEARAKGLLSGKVDFSGGNMAPGSALAHLEIVVDGTTYELAGDPEMLVKCKCSADPGTPAAFADFWARITSLEGWLPAALGTPATYSAERLAILIVPPLDAAAPIAPNEVGWPLASRLAELGTPFGGTSHRCALVDGVDVATLLPVLRAANQLTRFVDAAGTKNSLKVQVLVPGEPSPC